MFGPLAGDVEFIIREDCHWQRIAQRHGGGLSASKGCSMSAELEEGQGRFLKNTYQEFSGDCPIFESHLCADGHPYPPPLADTALILFFFILIIRLLLGLRVCG